MKPYKNIQSQNLGLLLLLARITAYLGITLSVLSTLTVVFMVYSAGMLAVTTGVAIIPLSVGILFISGLMAAIVAFEENYRIRTEHLVNSN